jgi:hypothetical protein
MNTSDSGKPTRRRFTKTIAAAIASTPFISSLSSTEGKTRGPETPQKKSVPKRPQRKAIVTHNTPPPVEISDGSLRVEIDEQFGPPEQVSNRFSYRLTNNRHIEHIRVLRGNGDKIYEDLEAEGSVINVEWKSETPQLSGIIKIEGGDDYFEVQTDRPLQAPQNGTARRPHRYHHPGPPSGPTRRIRIESIEITNFAGAKIKFTAPPPINDFLPEEYRILVWRE